MCKAGVEVLNVLRDLVRQDFKDHPIDSVPWMNAAVFGATFYLAGTLGWRACWSGPLLPARYTIDGDLLCGPGDSFGHWLAGLGWSSAAAAQVARYDAFRDGGYAVM
jgi:hypothetical protein